jgi:hypothetical protein
MKKHILLISLVFGINSAFAECAISGLQFFPEQKEISLNPMFIIQGYGMSQNTILAFERRIIYLESENGELIELSLYEILIGQKQLTQAIFYTTKELKPNTVYHLKYTNQTQNETNEMRRYNSEKKEHEKIFWKTSNKTYVEPLNSNLKIDFEKIDSELFGCGTSANAIFEVKNKEAFEIWYRTELMDVTTGEINVFYIKEWNNKLNVGNDMCSGAFVFRSKGTYKVKFTPMNIDGKSIATTDWVTFEKPHNKNMNPFGF